MRVTRSNSSNNVQDSGKDMATRIFILPSHDETSVGKDGPLIITLPHPRTQAKTRYLLCPPSSSDSTGGLYEIISAKSLDKVSDPRTLLCFPTQSEDQGCLIPDPVIYVATPISPVFLIAPWLIQEATGDRFLTAENILQEIAESRDAPFFELIPESLLEAWLPIVCDSASFDAAANERTPGFYRGSQTKLFDYFDSIVGRISDNLPPAFRQEFIEKHLAEVDIDKVTDPEILADANKKCAVSIIGSSYLQPDLYQTWLNSRYDFTKVEMYINDLAQQRSDAIAAREAQNNNNGKRNNNKEDNAKDKDLGGKKIKSTLSVTSKRLQKSDKTGMKPLSSFFKKKSQAPA